MPRASATVNAGKTLSLIDETLEGSGTTEIRLTVDADTVLLSLFVRSIASGTLNVVAETYTTAGEAAEIISFPQITAPTSELLLRQAAASMGNVTLRITHTDDVELQIVAKGTSQIPSLDGSASKGRVTKVSIPVGTPTKLVAASLENRSGILIRNYNPSRGTLYIAFSEANADTDAFPIDPSDSLALDVDANVEIWGVAEDQAVDTRIAEIGD